MGLAKSSAFAWLFCNPLPIWSYATFTQNLVMSAEGHFGPNWLSVTWSLAIEEQFYLFIPLLVYCLPRRVLLCAFVAGVVAAPILRCGWPGLRALVDAPWRADSLLSGATLAVLVRWPPFMAAVREHQRVLSGVLVAFLAGSAVLTLRPDLLGQVLYVGFSPLWLAGLYSLLVLIAFAGTEPWLGRLLRVRVLVWFGQLSYGIYLFHLPVSGLVHGLFRQRAPQIRDLSDAGVTLLASGLTLLLAALSYRFLESPILRLGHGFQYAPRPSRDAGYPAMPKEPPH